MLTKIGTDGSLTTVFGENGAAPDTEESVGESSDSEILRLKLVWQNASPTSSFAAQTVTVSESFDAYVIEYRWDTGTSNGTNSIVAFNGEINNLIIVAQTYNRVGGRHATINGKSISFSTPYYNTASNTSRLVPYKIFGIEGASIA